MMQFQVLLSLWSVTSCLCIDKIPEVAKTEVSKPKRYSLSKLRLCHALLKRLIQTHLHMSTSRCGKICITPPKHTRSESIVLLLPPASCSGDAVFRCETTLSGLPKEDTTRNQWLSYIYNTVPEQFNPNIGVCVAHFTDNYFLILEE